VFQGRKRSSIKCGVKGQRSSLVAHKSHLRRRVGEASVGKLVPSVAQRACAHCAAATEVASCRRAALAVSAPVPRQASSNKISGSEAVVEEFRMVVAGLGVRRITNRCSGPPHHKVQGARTHQPGGRQTCAPIGRAAAAELSR
jgi:hypothetical protein